MDQSRLASNAQPQADAAHAAGGERGEEPGLNRLRHARAIIGTIDDDALFDLMDGDRELIRPCFFGVMAKVMKQPIKIIAIEE